MPSVLSLAIVGVDFPNKRGPGRRFEIALCRPGETVHLVPEPKNKADPRAIMVMSERGVQLGYVTAERAPLVGKLMGEAVDVRAIFQAASKAGGILRVSFDGSDPELPPVAAEQGRAAPAAEPEFYSDEIWSDD
jgi:hypothetical protein